MPATAARFVVDLAPDAADWDGWVARMPGGHHLQTTAWASVKAAAGWQSRLVLVRENGRPVAGCQLLLRRLPLGRSAAYIPRGPVLESREPELLDALLAAIRQVARQDRVLFLKLQPPVDRDDMGAELLARGFAESELQTAPWASVRVDVSAGRSDDEMLQSMRSTARRRVRQAEKQCVTVRAGTADDLGVMQALLEATAERQGFAPYPEAYYRRLWDAFSPDDHVRLLIAEHEGKALSACLLVAFGDTVIYKIGAWGGDKESPQSAPVAMHFAAMRWARDAGYRWYDLEGIEPEVAQRLLAGGAAKPEDGVAYFKLGFGGEPVLYPKAYDLALGRIVGPVLGRFMRSRRGRKVVHHLSGRRT